MKNNRQQASATRRKVFSGVAIARVVLLTGLIACSPVACGRTKAIKLAFFYMEICPACEDYQRAERIAGYVTAAWREHKHVEGENFNIVSPQHVDALEALVKEHNLPDLKNEIPVLIANTSYYVGYDDIEEAVLHVLEEGALPPQGTADTP